ncbi:hypothetical protein ACFORH_10840 [Amycolatopsis roodepoortensis]|uniref:Uncharacterized protein n=1 Tax=Amycolatopsis roodepoortensis TaxID=700274 RepID=A0ABR9LAG2_9PSEU|nr:hypothetical protein [Amycolatopsis roodepoortensis]MBE1577674.1 hypothetical protein [Amycolatopsis roodepoortensis]
MARYTTTVSTEVTVPVVHIAVRVNSGNRRTDDDFEIGGGLVAAVAADHR